MYPTQFFFFFFLTISMRGITSLPRQYRQRIKFKHVFQPVKCQTARVFHVSDYSGIIQGAVRESHASGLEKHGWVSQRFEWSTKKRESRGQPRKIGHARNLVETAWQFRNISLPLLYKPPPPL